MEKTKSSRAKSLLLCVKLILSLEYWRGGEGRGTQNIKTLLLHVHFFYPISVIIMKLHRQFFFCISATLTLSAYTTATTTLILLVLRI